VRIGLGLASLVVALTLLLDLVFRVFPDPLGETNRKRTESAERIAQQVALMIESGHDESLSRSLSLALVRDPLIARISVEREDGRVVSDRRVPTLPPAAAEDAREAYRVPLKTSAGTWGHIHIWFRDLPEVNAIALLSNPLIPFVIGLGLACFIAFSLYLRRVLRNLDPSSVVPERIRQAFNVFSGGIVVIDRKGLILLANDRFSVIAGAGANTDLTGRVLQSLPPLADVLSPGMETHPWNLAMETGETLTGARLDVTYPDGKRHRLLVSSAAIDDGAGVVRGCLVSFEDVTPIVDLNERLERSNAQLVESKREIEQMNAELMRLATRDPLTGALNRRALFERFESLLSDARTANTPLCCIMIDIDHFKQFNDRHGHLVGDEVLRSVFRVLASVVRDRDVLARYGGEEFCIVLPGIELSVAAQVAERLRERVETTAGQSLRDPRELQVTTSLGVAALRPNLDSADGLIERADAALYEAKRSGRNRVCVSSDTPAT
jgi:diguanylate cyclase (GGDEF)-like protein/PAS domain S-box-containing protein